MVGGGGGACHFGRVSRVGECFCCPANLLLLLLLLLLLVLMVLLLLLGLWVKALAELSVVATSWAMLSSFAAESTMYNCSFGFFLR